MNDIGIFWTPSLASGDFAVSANDLAQDGGLETAVFLSLFTNRRAADGDVLPDAGNDRKGWWADAVPVVEGDQVGSRLWLLARSKETQDVVDRAREYAIEALQWLLDDRVAARVDVTSEIVGKGMLRLTITTTRPSVDPTTYRFNYAWQTQELRR